MGDLKDIGFYTLSDARAAQATHMSSLQRCELILTGRCNFACPYCKGVGGPDLPLQQAVDTVDQWLTQGLKHIRFSGGEPTLWRWLPALVHRCKRGGVERIAISTNGSRSRRVYQELLDQGVTDFSISLDAADAETGDAMAGGRPGSWKRVTTNIQWLAKRTYVTVGVVLTDTNQDEAARVVRLADRLGVSDIRVIPAAQHGCKLPKLDVPVTLRERHPILEYRLRKLERGESVRGLDSTDACMCPLVLDDMAVMEGKHYPCVIYMREGGEPIGDVGGADSGRRVRSERAMWAAKKNTHADPICAGNCLDVCRDYNNRWFQLRES